MNNLGVSGDLDEHEALYTLTSKCNFDARHLATDSARRTPEHILALARDVLGTIDLDPASDTEAQSRVKAAWYCGPGSLCLDGLSITWGSVARPTKVWLNPPGGTIPPGHTSSVATWWRKLVTEHQAGRVFEALFLAFTLEALRTTQGKGVPSCLEFPLCVPGDRLRFLASGAGSKTVNSPAAASAVVYLGPNVARFREVFGQIGVCT
jgi:hypothetical protein